MNESATNQRARYNALFKLANQRARYNVRARMRIYRVVSNGAHVILVRAVAKVYA